MYLAAYNIKYENSNLRHKRLRIYFILTFTNVVSRPKTIGSHSTQLTHILEKKLSMFLFIMMLRLRSLHFFQDESTSYTKSKMSGI
jgi:hypothetical protein